MLALRNIHSRIWPKIRGDRSSHDEDGTAYEKFVRLAYLGVLRREADAKGLSHFIRELESQHISYSDVLSILMASNEYAYTTENDWQFKNFYLPSIQANVQEIIDFQPFSIEDLDNAATEFQGIEYYEVHKRRFRELVNYLAYRQSLSEKPLKVLECGSTLSTKLIKNLLPAIQLSTSDFNPVSPIDPEIIDFHYQVDFMKDPLDEMILPGAPGFDVILFCEVIEHLLANPKRVIRFLLKHLSDNGQLYITTPNVFQHSYMAAFRHRINPAPVYPEGYTLNDAPHFHIREYGMAELLRFCTEAGAKIEAFYFSDFWDKPELSEKIPNHELSNLVVVVTRENKGERTWKQNVDKLKGLLGVS
jgi:hypothetical protein